MIRKLYQNPQLKCASFKCNGPDVYTRPGIVFIVLIAMVTSMYFNRIIYQFFSNPSLETRANMTG